MQKKKKKKICNFRLSAATFAIVKADPCMRHVLGHWITKKWTEFGVVTCVLSYILQWLHFRQKLFVFVVILLLLHILTGGKGVVSCAIGGPGPHWFTSCLGISGAEFLVPLSCRFSPCHSFWCSFFPLCFNLLSPGRVWLLVQWLNHISC